LHHRSVARLPFGANGRSIEATGGSGANGSTDANGGEAGTPTLGRGGRGVAGGEPVVAHRLATSVSAGTDMTCATERGGAVWCWGLNDRGQLGDGTLNDSTVPVRVPDVDDALTVNAGSTWTSGGKGAGFSAFACARLRDDTLECWGSNYGWLGDVARMPASSLPLPIGGASGATAVGITDAIALAAHAVGM
jgi:hypothetical protein